MTARSFPILVVTISTSLLWSSGCGSKGARLVPVTGVVTLNGQPIGGAAVVFTPAADNKEGMAGMDATGPEGNYKIQHEGRSGLVPGKYLVVVSKEHNPTLANADQFKMVDQAGNPIGDDPEMARLAAGDQTQATAAVAKTTKVEETFEREVPPEGTTFDFDLKASAAEAKILREN